MHEGFIFRHFFDGLALGGALAEWGLACWLLGPLGFAPPLALHGVAPALLAVVNRLAARRFEREPPRGLLAGRTGHVVLACAFGALVGAGVLAFTAGAWTIVRLLSSLRAEASLQLVAGSEPFFGTGFRALGWVALAVTGAALAHGYARGYRRLAVNRIAVPITGLPGKLAGLRLAHISDLHLGPLADRAALRDALDTLAALEPDLVCVTGDVIDSPAADLDGWMQELTRVVARHGVFAVLGNHDRHVGAERVAAEIGRASCRERV